MPYPSVDLSRTRTYPVVRRENLVAVEDFILPAMPAPPFDNPELAEVAGRIVAARRAARPVLWMIGGHVVKCGLVPVLIDLMERGVVTHLARNGAAAIHDFEIAMQGHTSEDVAKSIEDGSFGTAEETGAIILRWCGDFKGTAREENNKHRITSKPQSEREGPPSRFFRVI